MHSPGGISIVAIAIISCMTCWGFPVVLFPTLRRRRKLKVFRTSPQLRPYFKCMFGRIITNANLLGEFTRYSMDRRHVERQKKSCVGAARCLSKCDTMLAEIQMPW